MASEDATQRARISRVSERVDSTFREAHEHLQAELHWLNLVIAEHIDELRNQFTLTQETFLGLHVPDDVVEAIIGGKSTVGRSDPFASRADLDARVLASQAAGARLPLADVVSKLELDSLESAALLVALAPELDLRYQALYAYAQNDAARRHPSLELVLSLLAPDPRRRYECHARLTSSRLVREHWIRMEPSGERPSRSLLGLELAPCHEIIDFVLQRPALSITQSVSPELDPTALPDAVRARACSVAEAAGCRGTVVVRGRSGTGRRAFAKLAASALGRETVVLDATAVDGPQLLSQLGALGRAALLRDACPVVWQPDSVLTGAQRGGFLRALSNLAALEVGPIFLLVEAGQAPDASEIEIPPPDLATRRRLWRAALDDATPEPLLDEVATHFRLTPLQIARAAKKLDGTSKEHLFGAARSECMHHLHELATRVAVRPSRGDLVLPPHVETPLAEFVASARQRYRVLHDWGFAERAPYGLGSYALFSGPSGTGKTYAAAAIAAELGLELYRVDLSAVVSKYIGETEKNLDRVFREAEAASAMLVCDECDIFCGARTEISDARDRYANMEVAYLLQRLEAHEGIVILTTNLRKNIDDAFVRRIGYIVEFPFPDATLRERLFRSLLPKRAPVDPDIDFRAFARKFELSGGNIRNVLLAAASMAAEDDAAIGTRHVLRAISRELQKLGKLSGKAMLKEGDLG